MKETWLIIFNPVAGGFAWRRLEAVQRALAAQGVRSRALATEHAGHALELARGAAGCDRVAVYGGDGTLNQVANGLAGRDLPLALLPGGTANVMAHELGLAREPVAAARQLLAGRIEPVRPGRLDSRLFLLMAGFGFDGAAVHGVSPRLKAWAGKGAYVWSGVQALLGVHPRVRLLQEGAPPLDAAWVVAARARRYAGGFTIHPGAGLTRPRLGVVAVRRAWLLPFLAANLGLGLPLRAGGITLAGCEALRIEAQPAVHVQVDGEYFGCGERFEVALAQDTLPLCMPAAR